MGALFSQPPRRALLVNVTPPESRGRAFGVLHALDIGGGMLSAMIALLALWWHIAIGTVMLSAVVPLLVSTTLLFFVQRTEVYPSRTSGAVFAGLPTPAPRAMLIALLVSATLYGFSFYNLGFPILSAVAGHARMGYEWGVLAYVVYLGVSAVSGYALGARSSSPVRS
ncbi:major facilitator superfamily MFS_1, partial [mine drainage metagenome]